MAWFCYWKYCRWKFWLAKLYWFR